AATSLSALRGKYHVGRQALTRGRSHPDAQVGRPATRSRLRERSEWRRSEPGASADDAAFRSYVSVLEAPASVLAALLLDGSRLFVVCRCGVAVRRTACRCLDRSRHETDSRSRYAHRSAPFAAPVVVTDQRPHTFDDVRLLGSGA